jgi:glycosyltransferase involved in cell wall biosynthesis
LGVASVDVIIPCYNHGQFLPQSVASALSQELEDIRITIIDNASTDNSAEVAKMLAVNDRRIEVVVHKANAGPHASFNEGIDRATADYFMILCADDLLADGALRRGIDILERSPDAAFLLGTETEPLIGNAVPAPSEQPSGWKLSSGNRFIEKCCWTYVQDLPAYAILSRTGVQQQVGHYRDTLTHLDDVEMVLRLACMGSVIETDAPLIIKRLHGTNLSERMWQDKKFDLEEREAAFNSFFAREGAEIPDAARLRRLSIRRIGEAAYWSAISHFARGRNADGTELLKYAFSLNPVSRLLPPLGHIYRTKGMFGRIAAVLSEMMPSFTRRLEDRP